MYVAGYCDGRKFDYDGIPPMSASRMLARNAAFHHKLIDIIKTHASFKLNEVPDIEPAALPEAPHIKKIKSAASAFNHATSNMKARVSLPPMYKYGNLKLCPYLTKMPTA